MDTEVRAGSINERGFLETLGSRQGFNVISALDEIIANSTDADAKRIHFYKNEHEICMSDDGVGMSQTTLFNMFDMYRPQRRHKSIGSFNIGGKVGLRILSNTSHTLVISLIRGQYTTAVVPWDEIYTTWKYKDAIVIRQSTPEEIDLFHLQMERESGTTIWFPFVQSTWDAIQEQFEIHQHNTLDPEKSIAYKFGRFNTVITGFDHSTHKSFEMPKYNPSRQVQPTLGTKYNQINIYKKDDTYRYVTDSSKEILRFGKDRFETKSSPAEPLKSWDRVGTFYLEFYAPYEDSPPVGGSGTWVSPHATEVFNPPPSPANRSSWTDMHDPITIYKSNYPIGTVSIEKMTGSKRANFEGWCRYWVHANVHYDTEDGNKMLDELVGIQENKNQLQDVFPIQCKRLIDELRKEYSKVLIQKYSEKCEPEPKCKETKLKEPVRKVAPKKNYKEFVSCSDVIDPNLRSLDTELPVPEPVLEKLVPEPDPPLESPVDSYTKLLHFIELHKGTPRLDDACKLLGL